MSDASNSRVVEVVNFLATHPTDAFTLSEIAARLDLSHGSAHRVLTTLTQAGYLSRHPKHKTFSLGLALVMIGQAALAKHRSIDVARREMARLADDLKVQCTASAIVDGEILMLAKEGTAQTHEGLSRVGERRPFIPPLGIAHVAWSSPAEVDAFLEKAPGGREVVKYLRQSIDLVRQRGYSIAANGPNQQALRRAFTISLGSRQDPDYWPRVDGLLAALSEPEMQIHDLDDPLPEGVCYISAPIFGPTGSVDLELAMSGLPVGRLSRQDIEYHAGRLCSAAAVVTAEIYGKPPE